ncbi:hypothetical protein DFH07DRAFT_771066 [Mycena maculata]|uniref:Uncharacterized protein n=1 Tax=Mycena maculata TaxID=230809 RepID=A0AAD7JDY1_9AGAR|nr:hypothetical protein DFH07DRAFT_771066 [Mycena maculata]
MQVLVWDRPRNHSFASGTKWRAQAILPDAIKTGVDTACNENSVEHPNWHHNRVLDLLAEKPVAGAGAIWSLADWVGNGKKIARKKFWDGRWRNSNFRHFVAGGL